MYIEKKYRDYQGSNDQIEVVYKNTDILLTSDRQFEQSHVQRLIQKYYVQIEAYIACHPEFQRSLSPISAHPDAPEIIKEMSGASFLSGIGPFSAVAGAVAQYVGAELVGHCRELIIENGGDLYLKIASPKNIGLYGGEGSWVNDVVLTVQPCEYAFGIAASSGTMGHSLSLGNADLAIVVADTAILADTFVTILGNRIKTKKDIQSTMDFYKTNPHIRGMGICLDEELYVWNLRLGVRGS